ncbi:MAG: hypothetical protein RMZ43_019050 [Nostoc sp. CmiVER01]|uniref:hypothetical protein n=1 Tax=Nostoc sp. CmiVER01 TaxID=3075384 RepID=UPI002AD59814|nr:hypothetical protein [Nostoc sp. CmiVER01]MDZ8126734.1 hypothetical protein [Nostoc sp. CmiVER01]
MPLLKNKEALKIQPLQIELTIRNLKPAATGTSSRKPKTCIAQATGDDSDDLPRLKTGCKNFNPPRMKAIITPQYVIAFSISFHMAVQRTR